MLCKKITFPVSPGRGQGRREGVRGSLVWSTDHIASANKLMTLKHVSHYLKLPWQLLTHLQSV